MTEDDRFIGRWSRLKEDERKARRGGSAAPKIDEAALEPGHEPVPLDPRPDEGAASDAADAPPDLPSIDELDKESDYTVFMREGVPEELRRLALRKLWRSNPIFGFRDGLDDYDEDYTMIGMVAEKIATVFDPEKGMPDLAKEEAEAEAAEETGETEKAGEAGEAEKAGETGETGESGAPEADEDQDDVGDGDDELA